jgi:lipid-binding SYLF domain-containing protein
MKGISGALERLESLIEKEVDVIETLHGDARSAVLRMTEDDPALKPLLARAHAYAVFPSVGKAAAVVGAAFGMGEVFQKESVIGYAAVAQLTIGVQLGGETFSQIVVFENKVALDRFKQGKTAFAANASAVLVKAGAAASARYERGVAVFVSPSGGMLLEAAVGGQKFFFRPAALGRLKKAPSVKPKSRGGRATPRRKPGNAGRASSKTAGARPRRPAKKK